MVDVFRKLEGTHPTHKKISFWKEIVLSIAHVFELAGRRLRRNQVHPRELLTEYVTKVWNVM